MISNRSLLRLARIEFRSITNLRDISTSKRSLASFNANLTLFKQNVTNSITLNSTKCLRNLSFSSRNFASASDSASSAAQNKSDNESQTTNTSIDDEEIKKFKLLSNSWWIENGEFEALHRMNTLRVPLIRDTMVTYRNTCLKKNLTPEGELLLKQEPLLDLNILDVGCGGGILSEPLARLGAVVTGIDACKENIIGAQMRIDSELERTQNQLKFYDRLRYINCTIEDLASVEENNSYFDAIVVSEVVEHVNNLKEFLANTTKLLKNQGFLFITTINRTPQSYLLAILGAEYVINIVPRGTHDWNKFVQPNELKQMLDENETFIKFKMGMFYNPITKNWSWTNDTSVNYGLYAQKFQTRTN